jgi:tetratricopeptide (TPR) repeat protein
MKRRLPALLFSGILTLSSTQLRCAAYNIVVDSPEAARQYNLGNQAVQNKDYAEGEKDYRSAAALSPNFAEAHCNLGLCLLKQGKPEEAVVEFNKAKELKPDLAIIYLNLGSALHSIGRTAEAVEAFKKSLELEPNAENAPKVRSLVGLLQHDLPGGRPKGPYDNGPNDYLGDATQDGVARWPSDLMPIKVFIDTNPTVNGYRPAYEALVRQSFQDWTDAAQGKITIQFVNKPEQAELLCSWTENPKEMISSAEGGHAAVGTNSHGIFNCHITLLTLNPDGSGPFTDNQERKACQHEIGHSLGLILHSRDPKDTMFGGLQMHNDHVDLSDKDKNTILALYSLSDNEVAQHPLKRFEISGDSSSPVVRSAKLNDEAREAIANNQYTLAVQKLEEAAKIDPDDKLVGVNLGIAYGNLGVMAMREGKSTEAEQYYRKSMTFLEHGADQRVYAMFLNNYLILLKHTNRPDDAKKIEDKLKLVGVAN